MAVKNEEPLNLFDARGGPIPLYAILAEVPEQVAILAPAVRQALAILMAAADGRRRSAIPAIGELTAVEKRGDARQTALRVAGSR